MYGSSQQRPLPVGGYKFLKNPESFVRRNWKKFSDDHEFGYCICFFRQKKFTKIYSYTQCIRYLIECTLYYPKKLRKSKIHQQFPLACEKVVIDDSWLSGPAKEYLRSKDSNEVPKYSQQKLTSTFHTRRKYVLHSKNLQVRNDLFDNYDCCQKIFFSF